MATRRPQKLRLILEVDVDGAQAANFLAALPEDGEKFGQICGKDATVVGSAVGDEWQAIRWAMDTLLAQAGEKAPHELATSFAQVMRGLGYVGISGATRIQRACFDVLDEERKGKVPGRTNLVTGAFEPGAGGQLGELSKVMSQSVKGFGQLLDAAGKATTTFEAGNHAIDSLIASQQAIEGQQT